jgi:UDP-N-acetylglucosamine transferase subunit ALG13
MILITVGTTMPFDELLEEVDRLAGQDVFGEEVICQGGQSAYQLTHGEQFIGCPSLVDLIDRASMVVTHGGATVIQLLLARKPFVAFPNPRGAGDHQTSFLAQIAAVSDISWSRNVGELARLYADRRARGAAAIRADFPRAADIIPGRVKPALMPPPFMRPMTAPARLMPHR